MPKINEYPQAATINNNDLFVIDQQSGGDHSTKSASVSQIADKATSGVQSQIGDLSTLTTSDKSSLVGAVNEVDAKADSFVYSDSSAVNFIDLFASIPDNKIVGFLINSNTVSNCPVPYPIGVIVKRNSNTAFIQLTQLNGTDASYIGRIVSGVLTWRKITTTA